MVDFSHLKAKGQQRRNIATFTFSSLEGNPELDVVLADVSHPGYFNAFVASRRGNGMVVPSTPEEIRRQRRIDARLFAKHIVKNMRNVLDASMASVPFSEENVREFLYALIDGPYWEFDLFRGFVTNPQNFYETEDDSEKDEEEDDGLLPLSRGDSDLAGNS